MGVGMPSIGPMVTSSDRIRPLKPLSAFMVSHGLPLRSRLNASAWRASRSPRLCQELVRKGERDHNDLVALPLGPVNRLLHLWPPALLDS